MLFQRAAVRRATSLVAIATLLVAIIAIPAVAAEATVTGTLTFPEGTELSEDAVAVVTVIDQTASGDAGALVGEQRIDDPGQVPIDYAVVIETDTIDETHAYAVYATVVDGSTVYQNNDATPVITGGPSKGVETPLVEEPTDFPATLTGTVTTPDETVLSPETVLIAAVVKVETGTLVKRDVHPVTDPADLSFSIGYDPALVDPAATYVVKAAIVDDVSVWANTEGVVGMQAGVPVEGLTIPVTRP